ncbi:GGDEF domain-containing protein [Qipengyuania sp. 6B39]|uniref:GGDEF domain-containing protein n=1 Tax=Qipengyuania proteolytica TaxID=2867239 RepID=UPI001C890432|nr:GGDEF domain-containing protein [Qipengyuania proteolytica]MBX7495654.1 GGDEF domain-containing protein [Qipengyuania proteolytica]
MREQILGLITPAMALIFMMVFLVLWKRGNMGSYVLGFAAAYLFMGIGFLITHLVPDPGAFYVFHTTQVFYTLGTGALIWAATKRVGQHISIPALGVIYGVSALTLAAAVGMSDDTAPRLYIVNTGYGVMFVLGTMALFNVQRRNAIDTLIAVLFAVSAMNLLVRPVLTLIIAGGSSAADYRESIYYSVLSVAVTVASLMTGVTLIGACAWDQVINERERAERDMLTGLRARRAFEQDALAIIERAKQEGVPIGLVVADIDHFKAVNDVYGHQVGDKAIAAFGGVISNMIRNSDIAGRIGGEEFCILAWNCDGERAEAMAERIRKRFADTVVPGMVANQRLTASFGVAARQAGEGYGKLFARADAELYRAKEGGRNRVCREDGAGVVAEFKPREERREAVA